MRVCGLFMCMLRVYMMMMCVSAFVCAENKDIRLIGEKKVMREKDREVKRTRDIVFDATRNMNNVMKKR